MHGNVAEWTESCTRRIIVAWDREENLRRVVRGGACDSEGH